MPQNKGYHSTVERCLPEMITDNLFFCLARGQILQTYRLTFSLHSWQRTYHRVNVCSKELTKTRTAFNDRNLSRGFFFCGNFHFQTAPRIESRRNLADSLDFFLKKRKAYSPAHYFICDQFAHNWFPVTHFNNSKEKLPCQQTCFSIFLDKRAEKLLTRCLHESEPGKHIRSSQCFKRCNRVFIGST